MIQDGSFFLIAILITVSLIERVEGTYQITLQTLDWIWTLMIFKHSQVECMSVLEGLL